MILSLAYFFSWMGDFERVVLIGLLIVTTLLWHGWKQEALVLSLTVISAKLLSILFKLFFAVPRPDTSLSLIDASGFSFPSGHATVAMALYGTLGYLLWQHSSYRPKQRVLAVVLCALLIVGISFSRIILGVHWPIDIVGGWLTAFLAFLLTTRLFTLASR